MSSTQTKGSVYKTDDGDKLLLDPNDPKYRKPRTKKIIKVEDKMDKLYDKGKQDVSEGFDDLKHVARHAEYTATRAIMGFVLSPYIILRPILRALGWVGNKLYDNVFEVNKQQAEPEEPGIS